MLMKKRKKRRNVDKTNKETARSAMDSGRRYATFKKNSLLLFLNHAPNAYLFIKFLIEANETMTIATIYMMYIGQD